MAVLHSLRFPLYWSETDAARIAHFSSIFKFCEWAEEDFHRRLFPESFHRVLEAPVIFPRVRAECDFYKPIYAHEMVRVDVVEAVIGRKSIAYTFEVYNETRGWLAARCRVVTVAVDPRTMRGVEVPEEVKKRLLEAGARLREDLEARG